ncbi:diamine N-acetyltransferase [Centipeda periodontii DSM 2778]|uniref:Diamine N-acetyltransferase n=2 Tax=Centipeda TaxID=82202 RepID=F5RIK8_9FIRM|nr:diamine N-acetyltransferase [Centipeda periodontii DSM 2778]
MIGAREDIMSDILKEGPRLRLRRAEAGDIDYICGLQEAAENRDFIVPFSRAEHETIVMQGKAAMDIIVEEHSGERVGYLHVTGLLLDSKEQEWTHVIIAKKGLGYGHEAMRLLKAWAFEDRGAHRAWLDCKDYNARALHLYESEGMVREALIRETILHRGVYENLVVLGILDREYRARKRAGLEL